MAQFADAVRPGSGLSLRFIGLGRQFMRNTKFILLAMMVLFSAGCSTFTTDQTDERINQKTGDKTTIRTRVKARTFWESKSALTNFKASQTERAQGATVGSLNQEVTATNAVQVLNALRGILEALPK